MTEERYLCGLLMDEVSSFSRTLNQFSSHSTSKTFRQSTCRTFSTIRNIDLTMTIVFAYKILLKERAPAKMIETFVFSEQTDPKCAFRLKNILHEAQESSPKLINEAGAPQTWHCRSNFCDCATNHNGQVNDKFLSISFVIELAKQTRLIISNLPHSMTRARKRLFFSI